MYKLLMRTSKHQAAYLVKLTASLPQSTAHYLKIPSSGPLATWEPVENLLLPCAKPTIIGGNRLADHMHTLWT